MKESGTKKICVVTSSFPRHESDRSGKFIDNILRALSNEYEIHVIYPSNMETPQINSEPFYRHQVPYTFQTYPMSQVRGLDYINAARLSLNMIAKIRDLVWRYDIQLIHAYWAIPSGFLASLCCGKIPMLITLPGSDIKVFGKKLVFRFAVKRALKKATRIISCSNDIKQEAIKLGAEEQKVSIIPAGTDTSQFKPMDKPPLRVKLGLPNGFLMLYAGSLFKVKRVDRLIKICANLNKDFDCCLVLAGDGPEKESLVKLAKTINLENVQFKGEIPYEDMPFYAAASDVLVLASESEGLPACVQEAMACGIPVVSSNVGGLPEMVTDGVNGYLANNEAEMEEKLRLLISSPQLAATLGANAREFARQNLSLDMVVKKTEKLYASMLAETQ